MRVIVIGAGVGGLALAHGLLTEGHDVTVFEQAPASSVPETAVTIWPDGSTALGELGLTLVGAGRRIHSIEERSSTGELLAVTDVTKLAGRGGPAVTLPRRLLLGRLSADLPAGVVRLGARCVGVSAPRGKAQARFEDGSTAEGDVLVGADGRHSVVRETRHLRAPVVLTGRATWQGVSRIPIPLAAGRVAVTIAGPAGCCGFMPAGEGLIHWWFEMPWTPDETPPSPLTAELRRHFGDWPDPVPRVLAAVTDQDVGIVPHHRKPRIPGRGPCTLLGDSVRDESAPLMLAQGASRALEDAWLLVRALRTSPADAQQALRRYEGARAPGARSLVPNDQENREGPAPISVRVLPAFSGLD